MIQNENQLTSLPFYTELRHQDRLKWWVQSLYRLFSPIDRFLPFQICKPITELGGVTCPIPASINYNSNWDVSTDGWVAEKVIFTGIDIVLSFDAGRLKAVVTGAVPGVAYVFNLKRVISTNNYQYNAGSIDAVLSGDTVEDRLFGWGTGGAGAPTNVAIDNGYTLNESGTDDNNQNFVAVSVGNAFGSDSTFYIDSLSTSSTPYRLYLDEVVYHSNFLVFVDGWVKIGSGASQISGDASGMRITWNGDTDIAIERGLAYSNANIDVINFEILKQAGLQDLTLVSWVLVGLNNSGNTINRNFIADHDFNTDSYFFSEPDVDNFVEFTGLKLYFENNDTSETNEISEINLDTVVTCVETQPDLWTEAEVIEVKTGTATDVLTYMNANTEVEAFADYQVTIYKGGVALAANLDLGSFYLRLSDGTNEFFSEVFSPCANLDDLIKIEWWRDIDLINGSGIGRIVYSTGYINTMYLDGDIGKPKHEYDIDMTVRDGYKFKQKIVSVKQFSLKNILVPEFVVDVLSRLPHHEYVTILNTNITYRTIDVNVPEPDWEDDGDLAQLPIEFETDNIISSGSSIAQSFNQLLGDPTDAINVRGNNKRIFQLTDILDRDDLFLAADRSNLTEAVRIPIAYFSQLAGFENLPMSTSLYFGGELSINSGDNSLFDIAAGQAIFVDNYTDPDTPTVVFVAWNNQSGLSVDNIGTQLITYVVLDETGDFIQNAQTLTPAQTREFVEIGVLVHTNLTTLESVNSLPNWNRDPDLKIFDLASALGSRINTEGNTYSANGSNLNIDKSGGTVFGVGSNYDVNKKNPNYSTSSPETALTFLTAYGGSPSGVGSSTVIDTAQYDPGGLGVLTPIPSGAVTAHGIFYSSDTHLTIVHYGQFLYDSLREAVDSWEKEDYNIIPELQGVPVAGVLALVSGATDLSDHMQAVFIKPGSLGIINNTTVPAYSRYASIGRAIAGMSYNRPDITILEDTGVVYADIERVGGGNIIYIFGEREYILDCITGAGVDGKARIALTLGSASATQKNYVYITPTTGNGHAQLNSGGSRPTGEFAYVLDCALKDLAFFQNHGAIVPRRWTDAKEFDGRSSIARTNEWIRLQPGIYEDGLISTISLTSVATTDPIDYEITAGEGWQKHLQNLPTLSVDTDFIYISNHPTEPFYPITDLRDPEALQTSDGVSLEDTRFNWVFAIGVAKSTGECMLLLTLPNGSYSIDENAVNDPNRTAVSSFEKNLRGNVLLLDRMAVRHRTQSGGTYQNLHDLIENKPAQDLRGEFASTTGGSGSPPLGTSFEDLLFNIYNTVAGFQFRFDAQNLTANRIMTAPDADGTVALLELAQTFTTLQQFAAGVRVDPDQTYSLANGLTFGDGGAGIHESSEDNIAVSINGIRRWVFGSGLIGGIGGGTPALLREVPSATNPTVIPDQAYPGTGLGLDGGALSLVSEGVEGARISPTVQKFNGQAIGGDEIKTFASTPEFNFDDGNTQEITLTANITSWTIENELPAGQYTIYFIQDGTGGWVIPDPTGIDREVGQSLADFDLTPGVINIVNIFVTLNGVTGWSLVGTM